jgi:hypothetical protein
MNGRSVQTHAQARAAVLERVSRLDSQIGNLTTHLSGVQRRVLLQQTQNDHNIQKGAEMGKDSPKPLESSLLAALPRVAAPPSQTNLGSTQSNRQQAKSEGK